MTTGYKPFDKRTKVAFSRRGKKGELIVGTVVAVNYDVNRKPGIGRVMYDIKVTPMLTFVDIAATRVEKVQ